MNNVSHVTVLGAGVMGAQIGAHFANAGVPVLLLDVTAQAAAEGLARARKLRPDPFFTADAHELIATGSFDEGLPSAARSDWILEAVVERLDIKQGLFERLEHIRRADAVVSSNTSGIPLRMLAQGRSEGFRRHFLGTHFFNPPRYLRLLEVIPTADTDAQVAAAISRFADHRLGKGVVVAKDTPNFIGNHIVMHGVLRIFELLAAGGFTVEEIDAVTGPAIGRAKSATFRTIDIAGLDVLAHVARNLAESGTVTLSSGGRQESVTVPLSAPLPRFVEQMLAKGWVGEKAGQGFYKRSKAADGSNEILALDVRTLEYRPQQKPRLPSIEAAKAIEDTGGRIRTLFLGKDRVGEFLRATLGDSLLYTARVAPDIAHSLEDVDRAMRWGFAWDLGPFETWNAIGVREVLQAVGVAEADAPPLVRDLLALGESQFALRHAPTALRRGRVVKKNAGASLVDLGDGVLAIEFHSKMNAIGGDTVAMIDAGVKEAAANFAAIVVGNDAPNFSAGANLMLLLLEAQEGNWDEVDLMIRAFQRATMALRLSPVPVVVAPAGLTLGGGCEMVLHADRVQAAAESYIGLVEVGVGLIPAGGGTKEMLARAVERAGDTTNLLAAVQPVFETIGFGKVSTSGPEARRYRYLSEADAITMNRDRLLDDAKALALSRVEGYVPRCVRPAIRVGGAGVLAALKLGVHLAWRAGRLSDHDKTIGGKLAWVLAGGNATHETTISEQQVLDLEREAFLSLCGERKTQERIAHTLKTGKPLRN
ncbi:MAG: enoyl-CoA hydratase/isomerase family protein [Acidobacteria bacterium]|nr:enoyl-CoA hydratase/isomerase family protein [Acidobacteriota bacterium]